MAEHKPNNERLGEDNLGVEYLDENEENPPGLYQAGVDMEGYNNAWKQIIYSVPQKYRIDVVDCSEVDDEEYDMDNNTYKAYSKISKVRRRPGQKVKTKKKKRTVPDNFVFDISSLCSSKEEIEDEKNFIASVIYEKNQFLRDHTFMVRNGRIPIVDRIIPICHIVFSDRTYLRVDNTDGNAYYCGSYVFDLSRVTDFIHTHETLLFIPEYITLDLIERL